MSLLARVTIRRLLFAVALMPAMLIRPAAAQSLDLFEPVLLPVTVRNVPGAFGTRWSTELWYRNNSDRRVVVTPLAMSDYVPTIKQTVLLPVFTSPNADPSQIIYVERSGIDDVQFDLRLFNRSDPKSKWGTKLPVVREREFAEAVNLINVPTSPDFRSTLRIYALPDASFAPETVLLQIYANDSYSNGERLLVSTELPFNGGPRYAAVLSIADVYPELRQVERVRVHVESTSGRRIWAFVSVTSNSSQDVSVVTAH